MAKQGIRLSAASVGTRRISICYVLRSMTGLHFIFFGGKTHVRLDMGGLDPLGSSDIVLHSRKARGRTEYLSIHSRGVKNTP